MYDELVKRLREDVPTALANCDFDFIEGWSEEAADAIEELSAYVALYKDGGETAMKVANDYKARIEELENKLNLWRHDKISRWIPVTERLPEEHVFVLIRQDDDRMMVAERVDGDWWYRYFAYDVDRWDENEQGTITHWMPLPQPPKEE